MSDHHLRALARRAAASGSADDQAAWLLARLRAGDLPLPRLRLTAYLGDPAARLVLGDPGRPPPRTGAEARRWAKGLGGFWRARPARARAAALARACLPALAGAPPPLRPGPVRRARGRDRGRPRRADAPPALREVAAARARAEPRPGLVARASRSRGP
ncbi:MAG: hypothetical protein KF878_03700 [Planctomycetes bacterium]|nr:hypothetical protein [Planctomycetota bacterium]